MTPIYVTFGVIVFDTFLLWCHEQWTKIPANVRGWLWHVVNLAMLAAIIAGLLAFLAGLCWLTIVSAESSPA